MVSSLRRRSDHPRHVIANMTVYFHILKDKRTKLEPSEKKGTFVGYRVSHIEEQEASKDDHIDPSSSVAHPSYY
jgi:hypothetical protein